LWYMVHAQHTALSWYGTYCLRHASLSHSLRYGTPLYHGTAHTEAHPVYAMHRAHTYSKLIWYVHGIPLYHGTAHTATPCIATAHPAYAMRRSLTFYGMAQHFIMVRLILPMPCIAHTHMVS